MFLLGYKGAKHGSQSTQATLMEVSYKVPHVVSKARGAESYYRRFWTGTRRAAKFILYCSLLAFCLHL